MSETRSALLLGEDTRMLLASARSLGREGVAVDVAWCPSGSAALRSRFVRRALDLPSPTGGDDGDWRSALAEAMRAGAYHIVLPATEAALVPLQAEHERWSSCPELVLVDPAAWEAFCDKTRTAELARSAGVPVPRTVPVTGPADLDGALAELAFPVVVKPVRSLRAERADRKDYARICADEAELRGAVADLAARGATSMVQEHVDGRGVGVELLAHGGRILTAFQHVRLHETIGHGSTYRMSEPLDPELLEWSERLVGALGFSGLAMVEYRVGNGRRVLLEVNARLWGSIPLAVGAGASFPAYLFRLRVDGDEEPPREYRAGVRSRDLYADTRWTLRSLSGGRGRSSGDDGEQGWRVNRIGAGRVARDVGRGLIGLDRIDSFAWDDPRPLLTDVGRVLRLVVRKPLRFLRSRLGPRDAGR